MDEEVTQSAELVVRDLCVRSINEKAREATFVASTEAVDSYGEIVAQNWDLTRYLRNPVVLFAHKSRELAIGQSIDVGIVNGNLEVTIRFASAEANPLAENVWRSVVERVLRAVSVGFNPRTIRIERRDEKDVYVLDDNELFEVSVTPIPANPDCLAKMRARAVQAASHVKEPQSSGAKNTMNEEEKKALQAKLAERDNEVASTKAELVSAKAKLADESTRANALDAQCKNLVAERDELKARAATLETRAIEAEVDTLIGSKLLPTERESFIELRRSNEKLFAKMVEQRSPLALNVQVIPTSAEAEKAKSITDTDDFSADIAAARKGG